MNPSCKGSCHRTVSCRCIRQYTRPPRTTRWPSQSNKPQGPIEPYARKLQAPPNNCRSCKDCRRRTRPPSCTAACIRSLHPGSGHSRPKSTPSPIPRHFEASSAHLRVSRQAISKTPPFRQREFYKSAMVRTTADSCRHEMPGPCRTSMLSGILLQRSQTHEWFVLPNGTLDFRIASCGIRARL